MAAWDQRVRAFGVFAEHEKVLIEDSPYNHDVCGYRMVGRAN